MYTYMYIAREGSLKHGPAKIMALVVDGRSSELSRSVGRYRNCQGRRGPCDLRSLHGCKRASNNLTNARAVHVIPAASARKRAVPAEKPPQNRIPLRMNEPNVSGS